MNMSSRRPYYHYPLYARPVRTVKQLLLSKRMRLRRRCMTRYWMYVVGFLIFSSVALTFVVFLKTKNLGQGSSSVAGFAGLFFGNDGELANQDAFEREFGGKDRLPPSVETMEETPKSHTGDSLLNYFLTMYIDGVEISWSSEASGRYLLLETMRDFIMMMLEADIDIVNSKDKMSSIPVLISSESKPNDAAYDITMIEWMTKISKYSNKGMKLNFKDDETLQIAIPLLNKIKDVLHAPIWIHADVVAGPNNAEVKVDSGKLLEVVKEFPQVTLSLGWSTDWNPDVNQLRYTWHDVINMAKICAPIQQRVSFAIRAVFAVRSIRQLKWLLSLASRFTVTIWTNKYDILPIPELVHFRKHMDPKRIFYNLPPNFLEGLKGIAAKPSDDVLSTWDRNVWQPILLQSTSIAFMGLEQVILDGPGSWLVSKIPYQPELQRKRTVVVSGKVQFLRPISLISGETKFQLFIRSSGVNPPPESKVQGVRLMISDDGTLTLSAENLKRAGAFGMRSTAKLPQRDCYNFRLIDKGDAFPVYCEVRTALCEPEEENNLEHLAVELHLRVPYDSERQLFYVSLTASGGKDPIIIEDLTAS